MILRTRRTPDVSLVVPVSLPEAAGPGWMGKGIWGEEPVEAWATVSSLRHKNRIVCACLLPGTFMAMPTLHSSSE